MGWFQALTAGMIQGFTEFLPISSSGHLVIYDALVGDGGGQSLGFTVLLHLATLTSVTVAFRKDVWVIVRAFFGVLRDLPRGRPDFGSPDRQLLLMVIFGTVPAVLAGLLVKAARLDAMMGSIFVVAAMLLVTAAMMALVDRFGKGGRTEADAPYKASWAVGLLQAAALLPGLSRSGATIFGGRAFGLGREFAVRYAFLLSIPAILGAGLLEGIQAAKEGSLGFGPLEGLIGFIAASFCGLIAIGLLRRLIVKGRFKIFAVYCLAASAFAFAVGFGLIGNGP
ncbi:MAG: undecaprenyl-diphosphate phosphatase [Oscillospiraceae bacterium]|nr:undecaprenyl-diphosphate phosphatase [Oscillospiraceae bacterium]